MGRSKDLLNKSVDNLNQMSEYELHEKMRFTNTFIVNNYYKPRQLSII